MGGDGLLLILAVLPVVLILMFVYKKDKEKEPIALLMSFFFKGILSCFLVLFVSEILSLFLPFMSKELEAMNFIEVLLYSFVGVALTEETCKWLMVYKNGYNHHEFDEIYDILVYSIFVSLGFAFFENLLYVFNDHSISVAIMRAISAIPGHACDAVFMGYYLSLAKQCKILRKPQLEKKYLWMSVLIPTLLHGIYDFCLMSGIAILVLVFIVFVICLYVFSIQKLNKLAKANKNMRHHQQRSQVQQAQYQSQPQMQQVPQQMQQPVQRSRFCSNCGTTLHGPFCVQCGSKNDY